MKLSARNQLKGTIVEVKKGEQPPMSASISAGKQLLLRLPMSRRTS